MSFRFTQSQLIADLLQEVTTAQASFQAAQLHAWRGVAPDAALPNIEYLAGVEEIELQLNLKPYRKPWLERATDWLLGRRQAGEQQYCLAAATDPEAIPLKLRVARGMEGYEATTDSDKGIR